MPNSLTSRLNHIDFDWNLIFVKITGGIIIIFQSGFQQASNLNAVKSQNDWDLFVPGVVPTVTTHADNRLKWF